MGDPTFDANQSVAPMACKACYRKKRKCDRRKPACGRCLRVQQPCLYDEFNSASAANGVSMPGIPHGKTERLETISTSEMLRTLRDQSISPMHLIERYTYLIHPWLPIIDIRRIKDRVDHRPMLDADLANLILCIHIATQPSSTKMQHSETLQGAYAQAQKAFASSQMLNKFAIETIQCGILLAVYQLGAGFFLEAYTTLSTTTGLVRVNRLKRENQKREHYNEAEVAWWATFLLDRILALASLPNNLPLLMEQPRSSKDLTPDIPFGAEPQDMNNAEARSYEFFYDEIRSAYLAGQTIDYLNSPGKYQEAELKEMARQLTARLSVLFEQASGSWRPLCGSIALLLISATELEFARLMDSDGNKQSQVWHAFTKFVRITLEIAENYIMDQNRDPTAEVPPIAGVISSYRALVAIHRQNNLDHAMTPENTRGLMILKEALHLNSRWWGLADEYMRSLTQGTTT